jgi:hypothetical protein
MQQGYVGDEDDFKMFEPIICLDDLDGNLFIPYNKSPVNDS